MPTRQNSPGTRHNHNRLCIVNNHSRTHYHIANLQFVEEIDGGVGYPTHFVKVDAVVGF